MTVITSEADISRLESVRDRREVRNFMRFLRLKSRFLSKMMTRPRWQQYLGLSGREAWQYAKIERKTTNSETP